jgi:ribosomal protein L22
MTIGFTNDGMVFLTETSTSPNGRPAQITHTWEPNVAMQVADLLKKAAGEARDKKAGAPRVIIPHVAIGHG